MKDVKEWETGGRPPDGASVHACDITIYYSSGVSKLR